MARQKILAAAAALAVTALSAAAGASTPLVISSNSAALIVNALVDSQVLSLANAIPAAGAVTTTMTAPYAVSAKLPTYSKTVTSPNGKFVLTSTATKVADTATSPVHTAMSISAMSSSTLATFSSALSYSGLQVLSISGTNIVSHAKSSLTSKGLATSTGTPTTIASLTISAPLLGLVFNPLPTPGKDIPVNYVYAHNAANTIIVYLNRQTYTGPTPAPGATAHYTSIKVNAINVHIAPGFSLLGHTVSGDIEIGTSYAD